MCCDPVRHGHKFKLFVFFRSIAVCVLSHCVYKNTVILTLTQISRSRPELWSDSVTYLNECDAYAGGYNIDYEGSCQEGEVLKSS